MLWAATPIMVTALRISDKRFSRYSKEGNLRETTGGFLIPNKDAPYFFSTARLLIVLTLATTVAVSVLDPRTKGFQEPWRR